jgi:hypothetical protein
MKLVALRGRLGEPLASLAGQLLIAGVFFLPLLARLHDAILANDIFIRPGHSDAYNFLWGYWWVQKAVSLRVSPLHCSWVLPPNGADLRLHTLPLLPALISYPLGRVLGTVAAYNLTILGLLAGGALAAQWTFRRALGLSPAAAFAAGALFGFSPYFVYQAHAHLHLVGSVFWVGALGQIATAYARHDFSWRRGALLALFVWSTFWSSLTEFTMLAIVGGALAVLYELEPPAGRPSWIERLRLVLPGLTGAISLVPVLQGGTDHVSVALYHGLRLRNFLRFPPLSALSPPGVAFVPEFGGMYLPLALAIPAALGLLLASRSRRDLLPFAAAAGVAALLTLNAFHVPSGVLRSLPLGQGFRVFARFYPFFLFFAAGLAGLALERLWRWPRRPVAALAAVLLAAAFVAEYRPARLDPSPVRRLTLSATLQSELDRSRFLLVVPRRDYRNVHDTWAVRLDMRSVHLSFVGREIGAERGLRESLFPHVYLEPPRPQDPVFLSELRQLDVGYLLFESDRSPRPAWGREIAREGETSLWSLTGR